MTWNIEKLTIQSNFGEKKVDYHFCDQHGSSIGNLHEKQSINEFNKTLCYYHTIC